MSHKMAFATPSNWTPKKYFLKELVSQRKGLGGSVARATNALLDAVP
ncbi:hypothetical protein [Clostridium aceticum]|nr:hypothetical protein [Clostridium aceticum]